MQELPFSTSDIAEGRALLEKKKVGSIFFSEGTYQVEVLDPKTKKVFWPFLQLDEEGRLRDCFCTCQEAEKRNSCPHLAAAYFALFNDKREPLHVRFRNSLWNQLCLLASRRHGYDASLLNKTAKGEYQAASLTGKALFHIQAFKEKGRKKLETILTKRPVETEETSLKFSNLSPEEIEEWRRGNPSPHLAYELSFWSDLAKWWMELQEAGETCRIEFSKEKEGLPRWITLHFSEVEAGFYLAEVNWPRLIPTLADLPSPLPVHEFHREKIEKITYDPQEKVFNLAFSGSPPDKEESMKTEKGMTLGEWIYVRGVGFFPSRLDPLLREKVIPAHKIALFLQRHLHLVEKYLVGTKIYPESYKAQYEIFFNGANHLHIRCYLFNKGDLHQGNSAYFGSWVYLDGKGFYHIDNLLFEEGEKLVPPEQMSDFVNRHRIWLHNYEGFQTHVSSIESQLSFTLDKNDGLRFEAALDLMEEKEEVVDFGDWVFIKGKGFYSKLSKRQGRLLRSGLRIPPRDIVDFIHAHREELEQLKGFFSPRCPLEKSGLNISLNEEGRISVHPELSYFSTYSPDQIQQYGDFLYVPGEGFSEIPAQWRLPDPYFENTIVPISHEPYFVSFEIDLLKPYILSLDPRLQKPKELSLLIQYLKKEEKTKAGGWHLDLTYASEIGEISASEVWNAMQGKKGYFFSSAGLISLKHPRFNWLKSISKKRWSKQGTRLRLTTLETLRLLLFEEVRPPSSLTAQGKETLLMLEQLRTFHTEEPIELKGLESSLRPYQEAGVRWLWFLYTQGLSGFLCDEMGLGKTHQAMALLAAARNVSQEHGSKFLVVCPTSVIYHWEDLLKRFLPAMRVSIFYGAERSLEDFEMKSDLLLTSYGVFRSEKKNLSKLSFEIAIFDEIQTAKNVHSQTHKALRTLDAKMRLGLTGTPIENTLFDLKALFDIVLPEYLPHEASFREFFVNPIEKNQDIERKQLLNRLTKPFILRRKKTEVLLELPEKIEEVSYCALSDEQKELYNSTYLSHRESLVQNLDDEKAPLPYVHIFAVFSALKQICDHPCLLKKNWEEFRKHKSGKWDLFVELLQETRDSGQKLVVFSQYLDMLNIIESYLTEQGIGFAAIRGSTRDRKAQLEKFRNEPQCEVFVASLQAVGVGVDLVSASVVIHYDRWWNPAKENQATDRVHRIGQRRGVQVFKMVTKGTIEEHIHRMIERKKELMEGVIGFDDQDELKRFNREELIGLLQLLDYDIAETGKS